MRVKLTVLYDDGDNSLSRSTKDYDLPTEDNDPGSFQEAVDYLTENLIEPYSDDGYELEEDEEEIAIGTDYAGAWVAVEPFDSRAEAKAFLRLFINDASTLMSDLE